MEPLHEVAGAPQGFDRARIAHRTEYEVEANWKLVWENNRECFHCVRCHPQYFKANFDVYEEEYASDAVKKQMAAGVPFAVGSDVGPFPHGTQARELELMVQLLIMLLMESLQLLKLVRH